MDNSLVPNRLTPKINIIMVLILVVMDNSLVHELEDPDDFYATAVLILVVMDNSLVLPKNENGNEEKAMS